MSAFSVEDAVRWTGGRLLGGDAATPLEGVSIDTRTLAPGDLFVAIRGPSHDAHDYLSTALEGGACALLVEEGREPAGARDPDAAPTVSVPDTTKALAALASGHRARFPGPVVGITGSSGKTTTKELCAAALGVGPTAPCLKTEGNLNNEYGLPLTLLRLRSSHRSAVVELGMNHRGEIAALAAVARPTVGLVTNVGTAHIEFLGTRDEIAREKGDLFAALDSDGVAVVNADDERVVAQAERTHAARRTYGIERPADVRADDIQFLDEGAFSLVLRTPEGDARARVAGLAETMPINTVAAAAAALAAGAGLASVVEGLAGFRPVKGRMEPRPADDDVLVIDDTYNANPQSLRAALDTLARVRQDRRALVVLGDMGELGSQADAAHRDAGRWAAELGAARLFALGERAELVAKGAVEAGMSPDDVHAGRDCDELCEALRRALRTGDRVLVKGSRAMRMERVTDAIAGAR